MKKERLLVGVSLLLLVILCIGCIYFGNQNRLLTRFEDKDIVDISENYITTLKEKDDHFELAIYSREDGRIKSFHTVSANPSTTTVVNWSLFLDRQTNTAYIANTDEYSLLHVLTINDVENVLADWVYKGQWHHGPVFKMMDGTYQLCNIEKGGELEVFDYQENY